MKNWQEIGEEFEGMTKTDKDLFLKLIINLVETSKDKNEAIRKLKDLLDDQE